MTSETDARVRDSLDALGVPYEVMPIDPAFADTAQFCEKYGIPLANSANTIVVASKKEPKLYCACVVLATTRLDVNHTVRRLMGAARVSFATAEETQALTGMMIGGVTVFALPPDVPLYVDDAPAARDPLGDAARRLDFRQLRHLVRWRGPVRSSRSASGGTPRARCGSSSSGCRRRG